MRENTAKTSQNADTRAMPDAEVLTLSVSQPDAFEVLVDRYQRAFQRKATSILGSEDDARDAVQETFVRIYVAAKKFRPREGASFSSWGYTILINQCYTAYRKRQRALGVSFDDNPELAESIPDQAGLLELENRLTADYVMRMISKLPALLRRAVERHFIDGLPQKDIAVEEGVSAGVIRQRIHRAKQELRKLDLRFAYAAPTSENITISK